MVHRYTWEEQICTVVALSSRITYNTISKLGNISILGYHSCNNSLGVIGHCSCCRYGNFKAINSFGSTRFFKYLIEHFHWNLQAIFFQNEVNYNYHKKV